MWMDLETRSKRPDCLSMKVQRRAWASAKAGESCPEEGAKTHRLSPFHLRIPSDCPLAILGTNPGLAYPSLIRLCWASTMQSTPMEVPRVPRHRLNPPSHAAEFSVHMASILEVAPARIARCAKTALQPRRPNLDRGPRRPSRGNLEHAMAILPLAPPAPKSLDTRPSLTSSNDNPRAHSMGLGPSERDQRDQDNSPQGTPKTRCPTSKHPPCPRQLTSVGMKSLEHDRPSKTPS